MTAKKVEDQDLELIVPAEGQIEVEGILCTVKRLKTRELLALIKVITKGLGPNIANIRLNTDDKEEVMGAFVGLIVNALPGAVEEFIAFVREILEPKNSAERGTLFKVLENPDLGVLIDVVEAVALQEKEDLHSLLGKARAALHRIQAVYQTGK